MNGKKIILVVTITVALIGYAGCQRPAQQGQTGGGTGGKQPTGAMPAPAIPDKAPLQTVGDLVLRVERVERSVDWYGGRGDLKMKRFNSFIAEKQDLPWTRHNQKMLAVYLTLTKRSGTVPTGEYEVSVSFPSFAEWRKGLKSSGQLTVGPVRRTGFCVLTEGYDPNASSFDLKAEVKRKATGMTVATFDFKDLPMP